MSSTAAPFEGTHSAILRAALQRETGCCVASTSWISPSALFVETPAEAEVGESVRVDLSFPLLTASTCLHCTVDEVQHSKGPGTKAGWILGLQANEDRRAMEPLLRCFQRHRHTSREAPYKVLLVEDSNLTAEVFRHCLERSRSDTGASWHLELSVARNGREALLQLEREAADLVLVDYNLNNSYQGDRLIELIEQRMGDRRPALVGISAEGELPRSALLEAGADFFLAKPVRPAELYSTLAALSSNPTLS